MKFPYKKRITHSGVVVFSFSEGYEELTDFLITDFRKNPTIMELVQRVLVTKIPQVVNGATTCVKITAESTTLLNHLSSNIEGCKIETSVFLHILTKYFSECWPKPTSYAN